MKNIITLTLYNADINHLKNLATSKTNDLQLVELYVRNVSTERGLCIGVPDGTINIHQVYMGQFSVWTIDIDEVVKQDNLEFDTLGEVVKFIREYLTLVLEEHRCCEACA